jgi:hypothetical protein
VAALLAVTLTWTVVERFVLRVDRYRPHIIAALEEATGLPVSIAKLDLSVLPWPRLHVYDVSVGETDFRIDVPRVTLDVELRKLFNGTIHIEKIDVVDPEVRVPEDFAELQSRIKPLLDALSAPKGESVFELSAIDSIELTQLRGFRGARNDPLIEAHVDLNNALGETISLRLQTEIPAMGDSAMIEFEGTLTRAGESGGLSGLEATGSLQNFEFATLLLRGSSDATLDANFTASGTDFDYIKVDVDGNVESRSTPSLEGTVSSEVWWDHGILTLNSLAYDAEGGRMRADATRHASGEMVAKIASLVLTGPALSSLLARDEIRIEASDSARFEALDILVTVDENLRPRFVEGQATFQGLDILTKDGGPITLATRGALEAKDEFIQITTLEGDGFALRGSLRPDWDAHAVFVEAAGDVDLSKARLGAFLKTGELQDISGIVSLERLAGTFPSAELLPDDFVLTGTLREGAFVLATSDLHERFSKVSATFSTDTNGIESKISAASGRLGDVATEGRFSFDEGMWSGTITCDVPRVASEFIKTEEQRRYALPILAQYGVSRLRTSLSLPREGDDRMTLSVQREGEPLLDVRMVLEPTDSGFTPYSMEGKTRVELEPLNEALPSDALLLGQATVLFEKYAGEEIFLARADLTHSSVQAGEYISKRAGDPLVVTLNGGVDEGAWLAKGVTIDLLGERVAFSFEENRLVAPQIDLTLTRLARLLPDGATAKGRIHGNLALTPFAADLQLEQVGFSINEELGLDSVNGPLSIKDGYLRCRNLTIRGARSDCILDADFQGRHWQGELGGEKLDVDAVLVLVGAAQAFGDNQRSEAPEQQHPAEPFEGQFTVRLNRVYYHGGHVDDVRAQVHADAKAIRVTGISIRPGSGSLTGAVTLGRLDGNVRSIVADFQLDAVDLRIIDDMILEEPRGVRGILSGSINLSGPFGTGRETLAGANGTIQLDARDGSMGKMGAAGAVVKMLKTTEIFALKIPSFKEKGLSYDTASTKLRIENGMMSLHETALNSTAYSMQASGSVDFAKDSMDVVVLARVLESVSSLVSRIPGLRDVVSAGTDLAAVRVQATGSPYEPEVAIVGGASAVQPVKKMKKAIQRLIP